jgi:hypothetical protein
MTVPYITDPSNTAGLVNTGLLTAWSHANAAYGLASSAIRTITSFVPQINVDANVNMPQISIPDFNGLVGLQPTKPDGTDMTFPVKPDRPTFRDVEYGDIPLFPDIDLNPVDVPDIVIDNTFDDYTSALLVQIKSILLERITHGGTGLNPEIETAIFDRDRERALLALEDSKTRMADEWSKRGFSLPDGLLLESLNHVEIEFLNKRLEVSRDISVEQAKLEQANIKDSLQMTVDLEEKLMAHNIQYSDLLLRASETLQKAKVDVYTAWTGFYKSYVESIRDYSMALADRARTQSEGNKDLLGRYTADLEAYKAVIMAEVQRVDALLKAYGEDISAYSALAGAYQATSNVKIEAIRAAIQQAIGRANVGVETARANIQTAIEGAKIEVQALIAAGQTAAQLAAGAMAGTHVGASISSSFGQSNQASNSDVVDHRVNS